MTTHTDNQKKPLSWRGFHHGLLLKGLRNISLVAPLAFASLASACAPSIEVNSDEDARDAEGDEDDSQGVQPDQSVVTQMDATDDERWIYFDLDTGAKVDSEDETWDLAFMRFNIQVNGGVSGEGGVEVAYTDGTQLEDDPMPPDEGWFSDQEDSDGDGVLNYAFADWYDYDVMTHILTPKERVWFVIGTEGDVYALQIVDYYDEFGTSGYPTFQWKKMETES